MVLRSHTSIRRLAPFGRVGVWALAASLVLLAGLLQGASAQTVAHPRAARATGSSARSQAGIAESFALGVRGLGAARPDRAPRRPQATLSNSGTLPIPGVFSSTPVTATAQALVVAVTFQDQPEPTLPLSTLDRIYFGPGSHSVAGYFRWASYGLFQVHGAVVGGGAAGQSTAWLTLPHSRAFYAMGHSGMGTGAESQDAVGGDRLEAEVLKLLDAARFNWTPYENAQGKVPYLILAVASPDATLTGAGSDLWSYEESGSDNPITLPNGTKSEVLNYDLDAVFGSDLHTLNGLGTLCHEFSHLLGALDLYDTNGSIAGLGGYSLMGTGNYNGPAANGDEPSDEDAFTRLQFGWSVPVVVPQTLARAPTVVTLPPAETSREVLEIPIPGSSFDYLVENRQPIGMDAYLPSHGLLVYRVDTQVVSSTSAAWQNDCLECVTGKGGNRYPGVEIIGAGGTADLAGLGSAGNAGSPADAFPGTDHVTALTDTTRPSDRLPTGVPSYLSLADIQQDPSGAITFAISTTAASVSPSVVRAGALRTVTLTDPRTLPTGFAFRVGADGTPIPGTPAPGNAVTLSLPADLTPGLWPIERAGTALPLAYVLVVPSGTQGAAHLSLTAPKEVPSGQVVRVTVSLLDAQGTPLSGNFGSVEVDGTVIGTLKSGTVDGSLHVSGRGPTALVARLVDFPALSAHVTTEVRVSPVSVMR